MATLQISNVEPIRSAALEGGTFRAQQAAEKAGFDRATVAQALLPVLISLHLLGAHSQEWLCHQTFSPACQARRYDENQNCTLETPVRPYQMRL